MHYFYDFSHLLTPVFLIQALARNSDGSQREWPLFVEKNLRVCCYKKIINDGKRPDAN